MKKIAIFLTALFAISLLSGCISAPPGLERDKSAIQDLKKIKTEDYDCRCKKVRLGGKVVAATALKDKTRIEVISLPVLTFSAKPAIDAPTNGRFIAYLKGFVDPESLKEQYITVTGVLSGKEPGKIDQADYQYPVIDVTAHKQWRLVQEYYYDRDYWDDWDDYWYPRRFGLRFHMFHREPILRYNLY